MKTLAARVAATALIAALAALFCSTAYGQDSPALLRVAEIHVRAGQTSDFEAMAKMVNGASQQAGVPWRETWSVSVFGEGGAYFLVAPVKNYAQFDEDSPIARLPVEERLSYASLARNAVESAHYKLLEPASDLSLRSDRKDPPKLARVTVLRTLPGKALGLEATIKDLLLPALKAAGVKDFWVHRTLVGGPLGEYTYVMLFEKWADLDALGTLQKVLGDNYGKYMARVAESVAGAENMVIKLDPKLTYFPEK
jgi:quinol monooxygenase YgiN